MVPKSPKKDPMDRQGSTILEPYAVGSCAVKHALILAVYSLSYISPLGPRVLPFQGPALFVLTTV